MNLSAQILLPVPFKSKAEGRKLLEIFLNHFPRHVPTLVGDSEPISWEFHAEDPESALKFWGNFGFLAQRRNPEMLLYVLFSSPSVRPRHASIGILSFQTDRRGDLPAMHNFVCEASEVFDADYAVAHILTRSELDDRLATLTAAQTRSDQGLLRRRIRARGFRKSIVEYEHAYLLNSMVGEMDARSPLANDFWTTLHRYDGRERILNTPANKVKALSSGAIALQLTEGLEDNPTDWQTFRTIRERCKQYLGSDAFFDPFASPGHLYRVPEFHFPAEFYKTGATPQS